eukprot:TRINITY_DN16532_c0_g2_i3.p1 TRINITY_DN16532_c0_g2~~TRINITY_DN16532_c0_g2_i3.p1  ORF type:complete len:609 (-),score=177.23 TRINITY_DN16532_c0_g2_i3:392-2218(-)
MDFNSVFHSLQELFPQVDVRILKAVAIEHSKDVTEAIEAILFEVLPAISSPQEVLPTSDEQGETILLRHHEAVEEENAGLSSETRSVACDAAIGTDDISDTLSVKLTFSDKASGSDDTSDTLSVKSTCSDEASGADHMSDTLSVKSTCSDEAAAGSVVSTARVNDLDDYKGGDMSSAEYNEIKNLLDGSSKYGSLVVPSFMTHEVTVVSGHSGVALPSGNQDSNGEISYESLPSIHRENHQDHSCSSTSSPKGDNSGIAYDFLSSISRENHQDHPLSDSSSLEDHKSRTIQGFELPVNKEKLDYGCSGAMPDNDVSNIVSGYRKPASTGSLKTLLLAMESVFDKMRKVEIQEKAAEQAKEEASRSCSDILTEVENLKQMVNQARETYDMHAGEVYGEKSILATEARELQSRLLNLSNERDKSLSVIDEMQQTLQERLAAAEEERVAAEKEKLEKEESARKALDEQVVIMDNVVEESKRLQQEAKENSKLREFLMDRGRIVDTLQGEIAVICEDVKLLKERIDGHLPISRSLSSSQSSASSSLSLKRATPDYVVKQTESSDKLIMPGEEQLSDGDRSRNLSSNESQMSALDDEWVLFLKDEAVPLNSVA